MPFDLMALSVNTVSHLIANDFEGLTDLPTYCTTDATLLTIIFTLTLIMSKGMPLLASQS